MGNRRRHFPRAPKGEPTALATGDLIWALDPRDQRRLWLEVHPKAGLTLRQAMFFYDEEGLTERFLELEADGFGGDPPCIVGDDGWPTDEAILSAFRIGSRSLTDARLRLEYCLVEKLVTGRLVATGFGPHSAIDQPATPIAADRWRVLKPDFERSQATALGVTIDGILVFGAPPERDAEAQQPARFSQAALRAWYERRVAAHEATGSMPSRDEDVEAARQEFGPRVPREAIRSLRRDLAPAAWTRFGRRKGS